MTTATPPKADPYKDLSPEQRARVEKALAKAKTKPVVTKVEDTTGEDLPGPGAKADPREALTAAVPEVVDGVPEPEVSGELVESRTEPVRRNRKAKADLRATNLKYQVLEPLSADDMEALRNSVIRYGIHMPIVIDRNGDVIDGHHRMHLAVDNDLPFYTVTVDLDTEEEKRALAWELNRARRQMSAEQKAEIRWQKVVVEGKPVAEVAKELGESHDTTLRNVRKQAERNVAETGDAGTDDESPTEILTPSEQKRQKVIQVLQKTPEKSDHEIARQTGASQPTVGRLRKKLGIASADTAKPVKDAVKDVVKNKTAPKPTIHDEFTKAIGKLSKAFADVQRVGADSRTARSGPKIWEANGQEIVALINGLSELAGKLQKK